jgi:hypothetical protein
VSTATRDKKATTVQNYETMNQKGHDKASYNYSSKHSTYFADQNTKAAASASRMSSAKGHGGQSLKVFSNSISVAKTRPQTSYGPKLPAQKPYFVRFQHRRAQGMQRDQSLR